MSFVVGGIGAIATRGNLIVVLDHPEFQTFATTQVLGMTSAAWMMIVIAIAATVLLSRTTFGRYVYATGGNAEAARLGGVRINTVRVTTYRAERHGGGARRHDRRVAVRSAPRHRPATFLTFTVLTGIIVGGTSILAARARSSGPS